MIILELSFKKPSKEARNAMCEAAMQTDFKSKQEYVVSAENQIKSFTGHEHAKVVNSGNSAILAVMSAFKGKILIPDQGGWTGFKNAAEFLGIETVEVPTELGIINPDILEEVIDAHKPEAIFITSFAGYIAEQPIKDLFKICDSNDVILVEDASGAIGDREKKLANGDHAHVILASTGSPKIVNVGSGGFVSTNDNEIFRKSKFIFKSLKADPVTCAGITEEIKKAPDAIEKTINACNFIKNEINTAVYPDKRGITVALRTDNPKKTGYLLRQKLKADGRNIITTCPRYDRLLIDAICLEIKNIDPRCLENDTLNETVQIINGIIE
ncbi:MAG TPA: DegT/DnrJ/EryC1/StrS family aminotransferase [Methanobacterium sp.]|nr:DegT/DnrJ/EryC1/StrS family aminotransferase [Methanobacterium sp.]